MTNTSAARPVLNGRYELHRRIARGGMADVFLAKDQLLDRPVAVKVLFPQYASEPTFVARFRREAQAAANLNHPSIVSVYDWGEHEDTYFIVMEYVEGRTLAELIAGEGHLYPDRAAEIAIDVAAALGFAHRNGTVHRDVKPGNIMIDQAGQVKVADFGIARAFGGNDDELTQTGSVMGTASYFSPEQAQGKAVDPRSDLYSLGIVLFEMVVGEPPFTGNSPVAIAYKHVQEVPPRSTSRNPAVPAPLDAIIERLLRKDPGDRYPAAEEVRADLRRFREGQPLVGVGPQQAAAEVNDPVVVPSAPDLASTDSTLAMPVSPATAAMPIRGPDTGSSRAIIDTSRAVPASTAVRQAEPVEEYYEPPSRTGVFVIMLAVLLAGLVGLIFYISNNIDQGDDDGVAAGVELVAVPTVVNERVESAENDLRDAGFEVVTQLVENPDVADNIVFSQDPEGQQEAEKGSTVTILVSKAADTERVPSLTGQPLEDAQAALAELGLKNDIEREANEAIEVGFIVRTDPPEGEEVNVGTQILLVVSLGPDQVDVPQLAGSSKDDATRLMKEAGLDIFNFEDEGTSRIPQGQVIRTEPPAGEKVSVENVVKVFVSRGPDVVQVPQLAENSREAAETALIDLELVPNFVDQPLAADDPRIGQVVNTNPGSGSNILQGSTIEVRIGVVQQDTTVPPESTTIPEETTVPPGPDEENGEGNDDT